MVDSQYRELEHYETHSVFQKDVVEDGMIVSRVFVDNGLSILDIESEA